MLGDFINRGLMMILGYAYPAFECFKTVEKNKVDIDELRFWCQYWMIIAAISVCERVGDLFISWLPFYGEMKLVFIVYLWYPKTKGTTYVYEGLFKPLVAKHETDIDQKIQELKLRAWDLTVYYWQNFAHVGQAAFFNMMQYMLAQSYKFKGMNIEQQTPAYQRQHSNAASQPTSPPGEFAPTTPARRLRPVTDSPTATPRSTSRRWPPSDQSTTLRSSFKGEAQQAELDEAQSEYVHVDEVPDSPGSSPKREKSKLGPIGSIKLRKVPKPTQ